jgi:hypothetical protein
MEAWIVQQENPSSRFKEHLPWEDGAIDERAIEEMTYKRSIQELLRKLFRNNINGNLSLGETLTLHNLLKKYSHLKKTTGAHIAMNIQSEQVSSVIDNLSTKQQYLNDMNIKRKVISKFVKERPHLSKQMDKLERKLTHDIDSIDPVNVVASIDSIIKPVTTQLEEENFEDALYNENDGIVMKDMKELLYSCMLELQEGNVDKAESKLIAEECLKKCFQREAINMKDMPLTQYHMPSVPNEDI